MEVLPSATSLPAPGEHAGGVLAAASATPGGVLVAASAPPGGGGARPTNGGGLVLWRPAKTGSPSGRLHPDAQRRAELRQADPWSDVSFYASSRQRLASASGLNNSLNSNFRRGAAAGPNTDDVDQFAARLPPTQAWIPTQAWLESLRYYPENTKASARNEEDLTGSFNGKTHGPKTPYHLETGVRTRVGLAAPDPEWQPWQVQHTWAPEVGTLIRRKLAHARTARESRESRESHEGTELPSEGGPPQPGPQSADLAPTVSQQQQDGDSPPPSRRPRISGTTSARLAVLAAPKIAEKQENRHLHECGAMLEQPHTRTHPCSTQHASHAMPHAHTDAVHRQRHVRTVAQWLRAVRARRTPQTASRCGGGAAAAQVGAAAAQARLPARGQGRPAPREREAPAEVEEAAQPARVSPWRQHGCVDGEQVCRPLLARGPLQAALAAVWRVVRRQGAEGARLQGRPQVLRRPANRQGGVALRAGSAGAGEA